MKIAKVICGVLCVFCAALGLFGFFVSQSTPTNTDYKIDYIYNIDDSRVNTMPENIGMYTFDNYYCTNGVQGSWNESEWKFTPSLTDNTTCELYFKTKTFEVKIDFENSVVEGEEFSGTKIVKKGESLTFYVTPNEGHGFSSVKCSNNETATYDKDTKKLIIGPFNTGSTCVANFIVNEYKVKVEATNATPGSQTVTVEHGKNAELTLAPTTNYTFSSVECSNEELANWADNTLVIKNVKSDTNCNVKFKLKSYKVTVKVNGGIVDSASKVIAYGKTDSFTIIADEYHTLDEATVDCGKNAKGSMSLSKLSVSEIKGNATCTVTLKEKVEEPTEEPVE